MSEQQLSRFGDFLSFGVGEKVDQELDNLLDKDIIEEVPNT